MIRPGFLIIASASLNACAAPAAAARPTQASFLAATLLDVPVIMSAAPKAADPRPAAQRRSARTARSGSSGPARSPLARVADANRSATREPNPDDYLGAVQIYPWSEDALYRLYAAPGTVSDIVLQPGEALISVAAGDTLRWVIGDTTSGTGATRRTHILVKPSAVGLSTNLVIATDRRTYHVDAISNVRTAMVSVSWTYPDDALVALRGASAIAASPLSPGVSVEQLNFNYRIEGDNVPWRPIRAFDDGRQVFIQFPAALGQGEAPPLFVTGDKGQAELVNYRIRGLYYVVDRLFAAAELRIGEKRQHVVRIVRAAAADRQARRGS